jgi:hypothetical protein
MILTDDSATICVDMTVTGPLKIDETTRESYIQVLVKQGKTIENCAMVSQAKVGRP